MIPLNALFSFPVMAFAFKNWRCFKQGSCMVILAIHLGLVWNLTTGTERALNSVRTFILVLVFLSIDERRTQCAWWIPEIPDKLLCFSIFCLGPWNAKMWMHIEIKAIRCVLRVFFFKFSICVKLPFEAATIKSEKQLMFPWIFFWEKTLVLRI